MRIIFRNFRLKFLAIVSAIIFWIFVMVIQNTFYHFPEPISVQPFNLDPGFSVVNDIGEVVLTLNADKEILKTLTPKDFTAYVDLQGMGMGESLADILVTSKNANVTILKTEPNQIQVILDEVAEKNIPIKYVLNGSPKEGYEVTQVTISRASVRVKGAKATISQVLEAVFTIALDGTESANITRNGSLKVLDVNEEEMPNIQIEEVDITGDIQVKQVVHGKTVGIKPGFIGELSGGWIEKITMKPQTVTLQGEPEVLSDIDSIGTQKIDLRTISGNTTLKAKLLLPENTSIKENTEYVQINLEIETK